MKYGIHALLATLLLTLNACVILRSPPVAIGEPEAEVIAKLGNPTARLRDGPEQLLEYARGPWGQQTYMARISPEGKLTSYEQVLTLQKFATLKPGEATKADVLRTIGHPSETSYLSLSQLEVWSYPYKESGAWDSIMHVHFDNNGTVRMMQNGPDPRFDPDGKWPFIRFGR
jgi:hypothetical protein